MSDSLFFLSLDVMMIVLGISLLLCFVRLQRGPDLPNRTVAFDVIAVHAVGIIVLFSVRFGAEVLLTAAIITAVLGFLGTVIFARYLEETTPTRPVPPPRPRDNEIGD